MYCLTGAKRGATACVIVMTFGIALFASTSASQAQEHSPYIGIGPVTPAPIGWAEFCVEYAPECDTAPSVPRDVVLSTRAWTELTRRQHRYQADDRHGSLGRRRTLELSGRWLRRLRGLCVAEAQALDAGRLAARGAAHDSGARSQWQRTRRAHRQNRPRRVHPRQSDQ